MDVMALFRRRSEAEGGKKPMDNPVSRFGDRVGRRVAGWVNDRVGGNSERAYNSYMRDLYAQEGLPLLARPEPAVGVSRGIPDSLRPSVPEIGPPSSLQNPYSVPNYTLPPRDPNSMTREEYDRYAADPRSLLNERNQQRDDPFAVDRGPLSSYVDRSAVTRRGGQSAMDQAKARAATIIAQRGINANIIQ